MNMREEYAHRMLAQDLERHKAAVRILERYVPEWIREQVRAGLERPVVVVVADAQDGLRRVGADGIRI